MHILVCDLHANLINFPRESRISTTAKVDNAFGNIIPILIWHWISPSIVQGIFMWSLFKYTEVAPLFWIYIQSIIYTELSFMLSISWWYPFDILHTFHCLLLLNIFESANMSTMAKSAHDYIEYLSCVKFETAIITDGAQRTWGCVKR